MQLITEKDSKAINQQMIHKKVGITLGLPLVETTTITAQQVHINKRPQFFILETRELGRKGKKDPYNTC